jgi:hypothetical protein
MLFGEQICFPYSKRFKVSVGSRNIIYEPVGYYILRLNASYKLFWLYCQIY